ncbi:MAG: radical SAM protein [Candidatus Pacearchaeota archaeon]
MKKTKYDSYLKNNLPLGCKYCLSGEKLVLFITGKCSRSCWYCSLSENRKKEEKTYANERPCKNIKDVILEVKENNAKGAGITGGDPLVSYNKTLNYAKTLKKEFGKNFHIHIYLPLNLVTTKKIKELSKYIDEFRFHPSFLISSENKEQEKQKIKEISGILTKKKVGLELPLIPQEKRKILNYIKDLEEYISFVNLNEFEISETNFDIITKKYKLNKDTYTISKSKKSGIWIIKKLKKSKLNVHLCTAKTKDAHQYKNRLKKHNILPYGHKTDEGTVIYFCVYDKELNELENKIRKITQNYYLDKEKNRMIIKMQDVKQVYDKTKLKIARVEEPPTYNSDYLEFSYIDE